LCKITPLWPQQQHRLTLQIALTTIPDDKEGAVDPQTNCKLIVQEGPSPGNEFELTQAETVIGRSPAADIVITLPAVSGQHARVVREGGLFFIEDLNSSNGTYLNGQRLEARRQLRAGDRIGLGLSVILRFEAPVIDKTMLQMPPVDATLLEESLGTVIESSLAQQKTAPPEPQADDPTIVSAAKSPAAKSPAVERPAAKPPAAESATVVSAPKPRAGQPATVASQPAEGKTMVYADFMRAAASAPPTLQVAIAGDAPQTYMLTKAQVTIGRAETNDIVIPSKIVSRQHAVLEQVDGGYRLIPFPEAGNPMLFEGRTLHTAQRLKHQDLFRIGGLDPGSMVTLTYLSPSEAVVETAASAITFGEKQVQTLGRDPANDIVLDNPVVSHYHAQIERVGQRYRVRDLRSANGTFVNDQRIETETWLNDNDAVRIGPYRFVMGQNQLAQYDESNDLRVEAINVNKWVRKDLNILQNISLVFQPREFIVVVGQSGGGKSTLVDAIAGYRPATDGEVYVNDLNVYQNFDAIRNNIGFVPQRDIIHMELTVWQALDYAAQLRMPPDTTTAERHQRINEVLEDLDLAHRKDVQISGLSGGQQKRVSIGVELLTKPGLFFLDEPTSGLDPGTETALMQLMRRLADQGRTIVLVTHATKNVMLADKVVFLARGGYLAWFGPPDEALAYFDQYRSERDRRARDIEFDEIYGILDDASKGSPTDWGERYRNHPAYDKYITRPLNEQTHAPTGQFTTPAAAAPGPKRMRQVSGLRQFFILSSRNLKILTRDRFSLALMLAAPPLVSLLDVILALVLGRNAFDFTEGSIPNVMITLFLLTVYGVMVGGLAQMREIVKEQDVYKRERLVNLRLLPYIMSKIWIAVLLAVYASLIYTVVHYLAFEMPGGMVEFVLILISLTLATMAGMMLGLFASALAPNANSAPLIVVLLMLPQIVLGGALVPLPEVVSAPTSTRWAFQAFMAITGVGSDVAKDPCWTALTLDEQKALTLEQKNANCNCLGANALREATCNFPGLGQFYRPAIDQPQPEALQETPPTRPVEPTEPVLPPQPARPEDQSDLVAMGEFQTAIDAWQVEVEQIQDNYRADLENYRAELQLFEAQLQAYQERVTNRERERVAWQIEQETAVLPAEELIRQFQPGFGWTFVNKDDPQVYRSTIVTTWAAQMVIILILFVAIMVLQKRKDAT
jgi:ABC transport system ATP-binding/permease protein